jgi:nicotinamide mononucleotide adenylyltransferase
MITFRFWAPIYLSEKCIQIWYDEAVFWETKASLLGKNKNKSYIFPPLIARNKTQSTKHNTLYARTEFQKEVASLA